MILESALWLTSILFLLCGFGIAYAKGVKSRAYIFIFVLTTIFIMLGVFAGDLVWKYAKPADYKEEISSWGSADKQQEQVKGITLFIVGLIGLIILSQMRFVKTTEIGFAFGIGGAVQVVSGLVAMVFGEAIELKFLVTLIGLVVVSYLFYKYRDFLMGKK